VEEPFKVKVGDGKEARLVRFGKMKSSQNNISQTNLFRIFFQIQRKQITEKAKNVQYVFPN